MYLKKYCNEYDKEMDKDDYDSYYDFIYDFIDDLDETYCIDIDAASIEDLRSSAYEMDKILEDTSDDIHDKITSMTNIPENALNENQSINDECNKESHPVHPSTFKNKARIEEMGYDFHNIVLPLSEVLRIRYATVEEILYNYELFDISPDGHNEELVMGIANGLKRMAADKLISKEIINGKTHYSITESQYNFINAKTDGSDAA